MTERSSKIEAELARDAEADDPCAPRGDLLNRICVAAVALAAAYFGAHFIYWLIR